MSPTLPSPDAPYEVLLAEDEPHIRTYVEDVLAILPDVRLTTVASAEEALRLMEERWFDVVLSDQRMGEIDGLTLLSRAQEHAPDAPRMMITGYAEMDLLARAKNDSHVDRFLSKPFSPNALVLALAPLLPRRRERVQRAVAFARANTA